MAEQLGLVVKDSNGGYYDPAVGVPGTDRYYQSVENHQDELRQKAERSTSNALRAVNEDHNAYLGEQTEKQIADLVKADPTLAGEIVSSTINAIANGEQPNIDMDRLAAAFGGNLQAGAASFNQITQAFTEQAATIFERSGAHDVDRALDWARTTHPSVFREAIAKQAEGDISGLIQLARQFSDSPANTPELDDGFEEADPSHLSDEQLVEAINSYPLPDGVRVYMRGHVAYMESPEFGTMPLRTVIESGDVTFYQ